MFKIWGHLFFAGWYLLANKVIDFAMMSDITTSLKKQMVTPFRYEKHCLQHFPIWWGAYTFCRGKLLPISLYFTSIRKAIQYFPGKWGAHSFYRTRIWVLNLNLTRYRNAVYMDLPNLNLGQRNLSKTHLQTRKILSQEELGTGKSCLRGGWE